VSGVCPVLISSVSQGASLGDFLLALACPIEEVTLWEGLLYLMSGSETDEGVVKDQVLPELGIETGTSGPLSYHFIPVLPIC